MLKADAQGRLLDANGQPVANEVRWRVFLNAKGEPVYATVWAGLFVSKLVL